MKLNYLFPHAYKRIGLITSIPLMIFGVFVVATDYEPGFFTRDVPAIFIEEFGSESALWGMTENNLLNELIALFLIASLLMLAFSKEKQEDELIAQVRMESLAWAVYLNYAVLILALLFVFDISFLWVMIFNMFTILLFFTIRFNWQIRKLNKSMGHEE